MTKENYYYDGWENLISGVGTTRDKRMGGQMAAGVGSVNAAYYDSIFTGDDVSSRVVILPAQEMVRQWITVETDGANDPDILEILDSLDAKNTMFEALLWAQVYGGAVVVMGIDDGQTPDKPLNENNIKSFEFLHVLDRFELHIEKKNEDLFSRNYGKPETYRANGQEIHESRVLRFNGAKTPSRTIKSNGGWSNSEYTRLEQVLMDFGLTWGGVANLLQDFAQAVFKIKDLAIMLASDNNDKIIQRMELMDLSRSIARAVPIDADSEDFSRNVTPVSGLPELLDRFMLRLSAATGIPVALLFGQSPAGLQATGDADIRFFYDSMKSRQEIELQKPLERLISLAYKANGNEPSKWDMEFNPLWQMTEEQKTNMRKTQSETDTNYLEWDVLSADEVAESRFGGASYSTETTIEDRERDAQQTQAETTEESP